MIAYGTECTTVIIIMISDSDKMYKLVIYILVGLMLMVDHGRNIQHFYNIIKDKLKQGVQKTPTYYSRGYE